jgi:hypothetical protein
MPHRALFTLLASVSSLGLALMASSCAPSGGPVTRVRAERKLYEWNDDGGPGKVTMRISLTDQIAEIKRGDQQIGWCYVATGKEGHSTSPGNYSITEKIVDKYSNRYGWIEDEYGNVVDGDAKYNDKVPTGMKYVPAPMPYWMRLTSYGIGMHGGVIPQPGEPASHGCIRMPKAVVPRIFDVVSVGTPVVITNAPSNRGYSLEPELPQPEEWTGPRPPQPATPPGYRPQPPRNPAMSAESVTYRNGRPVY